MTKFTLKNRAAGPACFVNHRFFITEITLWSRKSQLNLPSVNRCHPSTVNNLSKLITLKLITIATSLRQMGDEMCAQNKF